MPDVDYGLGVYWASRETGAIAEKGYADYYGGIAKWVPVPWLSSRQAGEYGGRLPEKLLREAIKTEDRTVTRLVDGQ